MTQYDAILRFNNLAAAQADPVVGPHINADGVPYSDHAQVVAIWRASQDTVDGNGNPVHTPLAGYYIWVSADRNIPAIRTHDAVQVIINRDKLNAREPGGVIRSTVGGAILQDIRIAPVYLGCDFPWGAMT